MKTGIVAFFSGILLLYQLSVLPDGRWVLLLAPLLALLILKPSLHLYTYFICGFLWALYRADIILDQQLPLDLEGKDLVVEGTIEGLPRQSFHRQQLVFKVDSIENSDRKISASYLFRLNWYNDSPEVISGERWKLTVRVKRPNGFMNPGGRDYEASLFQQKINATGYVKVGKKLERDPSTLLQKIHQWRGAIYHDLKLSQPDLNGIIPALGLGVRDDLSQDMWKVLTSTGTIHLTAISGLHIGLIAGLAFFVGRWLWTLPIITLHWLPATKMGAIFAIIAAVLYAALAGFSIPTQRALIMVIVIMICLLSNRQLSRFDIFSIALLSVLLFSPASVISPGFWLSFTAVAIIFYTLSGRTGATGFWHVSMKVHFMLALGLSPLLLLFFGQNPLLGPLANIIAVPVIGLLITPLVLLTILALSVFKPAGDVLLKLTDFLIDSFWPFLEWIAELPYTSLQGTMPSTGLFILSLLGITILLMPRGLPGRFLAGAFFLPILFFQTESPDYGEYDFVLLDVGQGLSAVIQTKEHILIYDTGPKFSSDFDTGKAVVLPYLKSIGISRVNKVIISHGDNDHRGGYQSVVNEIEIGETLTSVPEKLSGDNVLLCDSGKYWEWDGVTFEILHPDKNYYQTGRKGNNRSCVLRIDNGYGSVLLTGDIETAAESVLISDKNVNLDVDILVAPHHGSKTSSTSAFISAASPEYVLFPVGYQNRFHFPNEKVVRRYKQNNIKRLDTAKAGAIHFHIGKQISVPDLYRQDYGHFWNRNHVK